MPLSQHLLRVAVGCLSWSLGAPSSDTLQPNTRMSLAITLHSSSPSNASLSLCSNSSGAGEMQSGILSLYFPKGVLNVVA